MTYWWDTELLINDDAYHAYEELHDERFVYCKVISEDVEVGIY